MCPVGKKGVTYVLVMHFFFLNRMRDVMHLAHSTRFSRSRVFCIRMYPRDAFVLRLFRRFVCFCAGHNWGVVPLTDGLVAGKAHHPPKHDITVL